MSKIISFHFIILKNVFEKTNVLEIFPDENSTETLELKTDYIIQLLHFLYKLHFRMPKIYYYVPMSLAFFGKLRISEKYFETKKISNSYIFCVCV